jgi:hypothetical protein
MVAAAKIEREAVEKKNEQLRSQIKDTESLLASHQEQMTELKSVLQGMHLNKEDSESRTNISTAPPSPGGVPQSQGFAKQDSEMGAAPPIFNPEELTPGPSCNFPDLIRMVCRADLPAYDDFRDLLVLSRTSKPPSRAGSGSYGGLNVMSLASFATGGSNSATSSPTKGFGHSPNGSLSSQTGSHIPLKDTRFYKRVLMEDIEPTLRLDLSQGISWLTRRTVLSGICEGSLVVEPIPAATKQYEFPCSVCGERRTGENNERTHRFRTSESETAQRYSLCIQCLERVRSCCEFTGYLRMILDGHIRAGDSEEEKDVWEETVRLRERMFWSRIAGGIVPLYTKPADPEVPQTDLPSDPATLQDPEYEEPFIARDITVQSHDGAGIPTTKLSIPEYDLSRPVTPDLPTLNIHDEASSPEAQRRGSIDSDISVYEEANAEVVYLPQAEQQPEAQAELQAESRGSLNEPAVESQPPTETQPEVTITPDSPAEPTTEPQSEAQAKSQVDINESSIGPAVESQPEVTVAPHSPAEPTAEIQSEAQAESQSAIHDSQEHHKSHEPPAGEEGTEVDGSKHTSASA